MFFSFWDVTAGKGHPLSESLCHALLHQTSPNQQYVGPKEAVVWSTVPFAHLRRKHFHAFPKAARIRIGLFRCQLLHVCPKPQLERPI